MLKVNDTVLYGARGMCRVLGTEDMNFDDSKVKCYVLQPLYGDTTIFVPVCNQDVLKKKPLLTADEIHEMIMTMPDEPLIWIEDDKERKEAFENILVEGDHSRLIQLIKTLYQNKKDRQAMSKKPPVADERMLREAERILFDEFAMVLDIDREEVLPMIRETLHAQES